MFDKMVINWYLCCILKCQTLISPVDIMSNEYHHELVKFFDYITQDYDIGIFSNHYIYDVWVYNFVWIFLIGIFICSEIKSFSVVKSNIFIY